MSDPASEPAAQNRENFPYRIEIPTRWGDSDMLCHINDYAKDAPFRG
jgi:hypothetical protein